jgi:hypothetical protein
MDIPPVNNGMMKCETPPTGLHTGHAYGGHTIHDHGHGGHGHHMSHGSHGHRSEEDEEVTEEAAATTAAPPAATIAVPTANPETLIGASGSCELEPARNVVKGGALVCRKAGDGNIMCMIMCDEGFRPWHGELIIYCRDGVFYNRKNPLEIQKNMKCKEAPCSVDKYGIACFNHPQNRNRRDADFTDALARSNWKRDADATEEAADEEGEDRGYGHGHGHGHVQGGPSHWQGPDSRRCNVRCNDGYENEGSKMAVCNYKTGTWELTPGTCEEIEVEKTLGCVAPQDDIDYGKLKCKLTSDEDEMRGEGFVAISEEESQEFAEWNTETMALVADRGMWELVPGFARKRRDTSSAWGMQLARHASEMYLVCWVNCKDGYEPKDASLNKIGCRMSDGKWLKPFKSGTHKCKAIAKKDLIPYCEDPSIRPTYVENGTWKNCNINKGKTRCDLQCDDGYVPEGNGKWVCENNKITHPQHSCVRVMEPSQGSDCRTPHLTHGVYACSWNKVCHGGDDHHVHRRDDGDQEGDDRGGKHDHGHGHGDNHNHKNTKNMCTRECSLQCDVGWKPLSGSNTAQCVRHTREWIEPATICVPENFKHDKHSKGWKGEGDELIVPADAGADKTEPAQSVSAPKPSATKVQVPAQNDDDDEEEDDGSACRIAEANDKDTGWGYGQCPKLNDPTQPCLPDVPIFDEGKEKESSSKIYWDCNGADEGATCKAICGPSALATEDSIMKCTCKLRKNAEGTKNLMCSWSGKIKDHCRRMLCPALAPVTNGGYIQTPKDVARKIKRKPHNEEVSVLQTRWGKQYKSCPTGVTIPKTKVKCLLQCNPGYVLKAGAVIKKANTTKASCQCKEDKANPLGYRCWWDHKARQCVSADLLPTDNKLKKQKNRNKKRNKNKQRKG